MTVVVISHRLITVDICDLLLVLENGNLVDRGAGDVVRSGDAFRHVTATMAQD
jgi:ABC-type transport system involved in Fe-S cluster assembly fused permease/ATPase subunit